MIQIELHIEILLLKYDCVIVPGLGGFVAHHAEAHYDGQEGLFLPPLRTLGFNPQLRMNDSRLAQSYVEAYDISYPEAVDRIESEVSELKQHISNEGSYELNDIGVLSLNDDGKYVFEPCEAGVLTPWLYGLGAFSMERLNTGATPEEKVAKAATTMKPTHAEQKPTANSPLRHEPGVIKIKVSWIRNAVAMVAAVLAFLLITPTISNSYRQEAGMAGLHAAMVGGTWAYVEGYAPTAAPGETDAKPESKRETEPAPSAPATTPRPAATQKQAESPKAEKATKATKEKEAEAPKAETAESPAAETHATAASDNAAGKYCIVLASRITKTNANAFAGQLRDEGLGEVSVYINNGIVRVVYGSFATEGEAYKALQSKRQDEHFEQAWVYKKR